MSLPTPYSRTMTFEKVPGLIGNCETMSRQSQILSYDLLTRLIGIFLSWILALVLCNPGSAQAGVLADRVKAFPHWQELPPIQPATGDLIYPDWFAGSWQAETALVDLVAPLAPELTTPGFEGNREYLDRPISFRVRFAPVQNLFPRLAAARAGFPTKLPQIGIVADRAFNGLNLAQAYLGEDAVIAVTVDPQNPNRQITRLRHDRQLESTILGRRTEQPQPDEFITTEFTQQIFRGSARPYLNRVEATTWYHLQPQTPAVIQADQLTAIYLSPQDPDFFKAGNRPIALYRYRLDLFNIAQLP